MAGILIRNLHTLVTMDEKLGIMHEVDILIEDGKIKRIGRHLDFEEQPVARILDGRNRVAYPGFINTHHHLYQTLTRNIPLVHDVKLFDWLASLYEIWRELTPEAVDISARIGFSELLLSGCTTTTNHFYVFPKNAPAEFLDIEIKAARNMGIRFHPMRGSMSRGKSNGGLPRRCRPITGRHPQGLPARD